MLKVFRRGSTRMIAASAVLLMGLVCLYYANYAAYPASSLPAGVPGASSSSTPTTPARAPGGPGGAGAPAAGVAELYDAASAAAHAAAEAGRLARVAAAAAAAVAVAEGAHRPSEQASNDSLADPLNAWEGPNEPDSLVSAATCPVPTLAEADVDTLETFQKFDFQVSHHRKNFSRTLCL